MSTLLYNLNQIYPGKDSDGENCYPTLQGRFQKNQTPSSKITCSILRATLFMLKTRLKNLARLV